MGFHISALAIAVVIVVFGLTQLFKKCVKWSPIYFSWVVAAGCVAAAWFLFPGEVALEDVCWVIIGVFGLQGGVKNAQTILASFQQFRGRDRIDPRGPGYPEVDK